MPQTEGIEHFARNLATWIASLFFMTVLVGIAVYERANPGNMTFSTTTGSMKKFRAEHTATLLGDGKVLIAGGSGDGGILSSAELYDPSAETFSATDMSDSADYDPETQKKGDTRQQ